MKIVVDTNVLISGIFFGGKPKEVLKLCFNGAVNAYVTDEIVSEYRRVVQEMQNRVKRKVPRTALDSFILKAESIVNRAKVDACRDPDDNKFIECAVSAKAVYIVSGDKDLLDLKAYQDIKILTASEFLELQQSH